MSASPLPVDQREIDFGNLDYSSSVSQPTNVQSKKALAVRGHNGLYLVFESDLQSKPKTLQAVMAACCKEQPDIVSRMDVRAGLPTIVNSRITVQYVLDRLAVHGDIKKVAKLLPQISEAQLRSAIAFARDFLELACGQPEADD
jgi:uncharacterized protein (DUF433 family)